MAALVLSVSLVGCSEDKGNSISGSVSSVVSQAQEFAVDDDVTVEMSGTMDPYCITNVGKGGLVFFTSGNDKVTVYFDSLSEEDARGLNGGRVTIVGELNGRNTTLHSITLMNSSVQ